MLLSDYQLQVQQLVHDTAGIDYSQSDLTGFINQARSVTAQNFWCVRTLFQPCSLVVGQGGATDNNGNIIGEVYPMNGGVGGGTILAGGSWVSPPQISFSLPPGNQVGAAGGGPGLVRALGFPIMSGTAPNQTISQIAMTNWGAGYVATPTLNLVGGTGVPNPANPVTNVTGIVGAPSGLINVSVASTTGFNSGDWVAIASVLGTTEANGNWQIDVTPPTTIQLRASKFVNAYISGGTVTDGIAVLAAKPLINVIDIYTITYKFGLQAPMLQWSPFAPYQAFLRAYRGQTGAPAVWSNFTEMNQFYIWPMLPDQNYPIEIDAYVIPNPLVNQTDVDTQVLAPLNDCVQYYAAHLAISKTQNFQQASFFLNRYNTRAKELGASRFAPRRPNIYQGNWRRLQRGYW